MSDKRTSEETAASVLDGTELVRIVQSGENKKAILGDVGRALRSAGTPGNYTLAASGILVKNADGVEVFRIWGTDPDDVNNYNSDNIYLGKLAGADQPTDNVSAGYSNTGVGAYALQHITTGAANAAFGQSAGAEITTGGSNSLVGSGAGGFITTGSRNTAIGYATGVGSGNDDECVSDQRMVFVGTFATRAGVPKATPLINGIAIGYEAQVTGSNRAVIGGTDITDAYFGSEAGLAKLHGKGDAVVFPDSDPHVAGAAYWVAGVLTKSAG